MICRVEIYLNRATFVDLLRTEPKGLVRSNPPLGEYFIYSPFTENNLRSRTDVLHVSAPTILLRQSWSWGLCFNTLL